MFSYNVSEDSLRTNPWSREESHPYDTILHLASLSEHHQLLSEAEVARKYQETVGAYGVDMIDQVNEAQKKLSAIRLRCTELLMENEASDIMRSEELRSNVEKVKLIMNGFESCVTEAGRLQKTLRQPFQVNFMKIEKKYHENILDLFTKAVKFLGNLQDELDTLDWHKQNLVDDATIKKVNELLSKSVLDLEFGLQKVNETKHCLESQVAFDADENDLNQHDRQLDL